MDSIRVSEAPDPGSIPGEATKNIYVSPYWASCTYLNIHDFATRPHAIFSIPQMPGQGTQTPAQSQPCKELKMPTLHTTGQAFENKQLYNLSCKYYIN